MKKISREQLYGFINSIKLEQCHPRVIIKLMPFLLFYNLISIAVGWYFSEVPSLSRIATLFMHISNVLLILFGVCWLIFLIKPIAIRFQQILYLLGIIQIEIILVQIIFFGLMALGTVAKWEEKSFQLFILVTFTIIFILIVSSFFRLIVNIKANKFTHESINSRKDLKLKRETKFLKAAINEKTIVVIVVALIVLKYLIPLVFKIVVALMLMLLPLTGIYIFPHLLISAYCLFKYKEYRIRKW